MTESDCSAGFYIWMGVLKRAFGSDRVWSSCCDTLRLKSDVKVQLLTINISNLRWFPIPETILCFMVSSIEFKMVPCARKIPYALYSVFQRFPHRSLWNGSNVGLIDDGLLSSIQGRPPSASTFHTYLPGYRWRDVLGFMTAGSVSSSPTLAFRDANHLWFLFVCMFVFPASLFTLVTFKFIEH